MTVDGIISNIGSANLNARSARLDERDRHRCHRPGARGTDRHFDEDLRRSVGFAPLAGSTAPSFSASKNRRVRPVKRPF
jgi:phosphatidylserine/phosphatidylglycerophosphate/cardiolipin synthase-like enzyme